MSSAYYTQRSKMLVALAIAKNTTLQQSREPRYNNFVKPTDQMGTENTGPVVANAGAESASVAPPSAPVRNASVPVFGNAAANFETPQDMTMPVPPFNESQSLTAVTTEDGTEIEVEEGDPSLGKDSKRSRWLARKRNSGRCKIDKELKKRHLHAQLEKVLKPKNAAVIFKELNLKPQYRIQKNCIIKGQCLSDRTYTAHLKLDDHTYCGESKTISGAKMVAADVALTDWFYKKLWKTETVVPVEKMGTEENGVPKPEPAPWSALGAYAMHSLLARWQMDPNTIFNVSGGSSVPTEGAPVSNHVTPATATAPAKKASWAPIFVSALVNYTPPENPKFPENTEQHQPLYVLNLAFPNLPFVEKEDEANWETRFICSANSKELCMKLKRQNTLLGPTGTFLGLASQPESLPPGGESKKHKTLITKAPSKKEARRQVAVQILKTYGFDFANAAST